MAQPRKLHDRFFKQAKAEGYAARSAYKLLEIQERKGILRKGDRVLDLGCAPGSWVQAASLIVGPKGLVVGVDLKPVTIQIPAIAMTRVGDVFEITPDDFAAALSPASGRGARFDAILSDMAPNTEGGAGGTIDHFRSIELCRRVLELVPRLLRRDGALVMKVFEGESYTELLSETRTLFGDVKGFKPEASRDVSREMYVVAKGFRGTDPASSAAGAAAASVPIVASAQPKPRAGWAGGVGGGGGA